MVETAIYQVRVQSQQQLHRIQFSSFSKVHTFHLLERVLVSAFQRFKAHISRLFCFDSYLHFIVALLAYPYKAPCNQYYQFIVSRS